MKHYILILFTCIVGRLLVADNGWGFVAVMEADGLDTKGHVAATLNGGERFVVKKEVKVEGDVAYYVTFFERKKRPSYILMARDCYVSYDTLPDKKSDPEGNAKENAKRKKIATYYSKYATRERLRQRAINTHRKKSPHARLKKETQALGKVRKSLLSLNERIEKNDVARKNATGAAHIKLVEEGRELRAEQGSLPARYKEQKAIVEKLEADAKKWDAEHPFDETRVVQSVAWKKMTAELEALAKELSEAGVKLTNDVNASKGNAQ